MGKKIYERDVIDILTGSKGKPIYIETHREDAMNYARNVAKTQRSVKVIKNDGGSYSVISEGKTLARFG